MNFKVVILTIATFTVGLVELIIGGVLPQIAQDLNVSVSTAGQLIMIYALVYAIAGPTLLALTAKLNENDCTCGRCLSLFWEVCWPSGVRIMLSCLYPVSLPLQAGR